MSSTPITLRNATDAFANETRAAENYAATTRLRLDNSSGAKKYAYVYFARPFPLGVNVVSAKLKLYADAKSGSWSAVSRTITVSRVTQAWKAGRLTWNNRPSVTTTGQVAVTKTSSITDGQLWEFDVTAMLQLVADGTAWYGFRVEINESVLRRLYSANAAVYKPTLELTWSKAPEAPSDLSPSGNRSVVVSKPILRFDFTDEYGNTDMQACQVQINSTDVWTSPSFDSGTVSTSVPQLDLSTTAYAGLSDGSSTYWRVRVQDGAGLWSGWSTAAQFKRTTRGTLTITNPAASPNDYVTEATPPIIWSLSGRTQKAYQVVIKDVDGEWIHTSGKVDGTATSYTLPKGIIHDDETYTVLVKVWDTIDRQKTPEETEVPTTASRSFTYQRQTSVAAPVGLTATDMTPEPGVQLEWTRSTAPDSWTISRNGKVIDSGVLPVDTLVSGTTYRYVDRTAHPRKSHTYKVRAKVNGVDSKNNPTASVTIKPVGIWLDDEDRGIRVQLLGNDEGSWTMGETADVYTPVGSTKAVRITQALRGYEGSISGLLTATATKTLAQVEDDLLKLKERPGRTYQLVLADLSIPVVIGNVTIAPTPRAEIERLVTFDFWQVGDLTFKPRL